MVNVGDQVYIVHDDFDIVPAIVRGIIPDGRIDVFPSKGTCDQYPWQVSKKIRNYQGD